MDESTSIGGFAGSIRCVIALIFAIMAGCATSPSQVFEPLSETEIAVLELNTEWLKECEGIGPPPANNTGNLLDDFIDVAQALAACRATHKELSDYITKAYDKAVEKRTRVDQPKK